MEQVTTHELILELIKRGAVRKTDRPYTEERVYIEEKYTTDRKKTVVHDLLILDNVKEI